MNIRRSFAFLLFIVIGLNSNAQDFKTKQTTLVIKKTADWCPFCGLYGWDYFKGLYDDVKTNENAILVSMHYSGGLQSNAALQITNNFDAPGQPVIFVNNEDILLNSSNTNAKITETKATIQSNSGRDAAIALDLDLVKINAAKFNINVKAKAAQDLTGVETFVGIYKVQNNVIHNQASRSSTASHTNVLQGAYHSGSVWGLPLFTGNVSTGAEMTTSIELDAFTTSADTKILAIVWIKGPNGKYSYLNGQMINSSELTTSNREIEQNVNFQAYYSNDRVEVNWGGQKIEKCLLVNTLGQALSLTKIKEEGEKYTFESPNVTSGNYFVVVHSGGQVRSKAIQIQK